MKKMSLGFTALFIPALVFAQPVIEGNIISWEGNDWYQVQSATDYTTICEGTSSCKVTAGEYIVINHTTGQRFTDIVIGDSLNTETQFTVEGQSILLPGNDWYQVQSAVDYTSICEGVRTCAVTPGTYIVINHTTGERSDGVDVGKQTQPGPQPTLVTVVGNTLSWSDDGWYQVQNAQDYSEICAGTLSCDVDAGTYIVINHTTGVREELTVTAVGGVGSPVEPRPPVVEYDLPVDTGSTPAPMGISIAVYGDSIAELNWTRPFYGDGITVNEIWRDGVLLEEIPGGGNSYVDYARTPSQAYTYHIAAINKNGRATTAFVETNGTVANPVDPVISTLSLPAELEKRLGNTFHLLNGIAFQRMAAVALRILESEPADIGLALIESGEYGDDYSCPKGGKVNIEKREGGGSFIANDCSLGALSLSGSFFIDVLTSSKSNLYQSGSASLTDARDNTTIGMGYSVISYDEDDNISSFISNDLSVSGPEISYSVGVIDASIDNPNFQTVGFAGRFGITGSGFSNTLGPLNRPRTMEAFELNDTGRAQVGALAFNSMDRGNATYGLTVNNGNPDTFTLNETIDGAITSYDVAWGDRYSLQMPNLSTFDVGF